MSPRTISLDRLIGPYCVLIALAMISHKQPAVHVMTALIHHAKIVRSIS